MTCISGIGIKDETLFATEEPNCSCDTNGLPLHQFYQSRPVSLADSPPEKCG